MKAAFSDALKRAAVKFGVGRYLYRLPAQWLDYDSQKRQFARPPTLPDWAKLSAVKKKKAERTKAWRGVFETDALAAGSILATSTLDASNVGRASSVQRAAAPCAWSLLNHTHTPKRTSAATTPP